MTDDRDPIDTWLEREVTPLAPRTGSLDQIRHTARRRKAAQAVMAAAGCAVIIGAAVAVPQFIAGSTQHGSGQGSTPAAQGSTSLSQSSPPSPQTSTAAPRIPGNQRTGHTSLLAGGLVPVNFRPTSVTFVGTGRNTVVGAVIGQAGDKGHPCATQFCTSLAGTSDYGQAWFGVSAPLTGPPDGGAGVSQLRFATVYDGWAYGPALFETSDAGANWSQENTSGQRVVALEAAAGRAFAVFARCSGSTAAFANDCTSFALYTSSGGSQDWTAVAVPAAFRTMGSAMPSSVSLIMAGTTGYLVDPSGQLLRGPASGGAWTLAGHLPCLPGNAQASGLPQDAHLAAWAPSPTASTTLVLACDRYSSLGPTVTTYTSTTGRTWTPAGTSRVAGPATSLAAAATGRLVLATQAGIYYSTDHGAAWQPAGIAGHQPPGGFGYVGMTNLSDGVAVPADAALGEVFVTTDGGLTWHPSLISR